MVENTTAEKVYNFSAGPCILPKAVFERAAAEMCNWHGTKISVMEMSHRGKAFVSIADKMRADLREFLHVPENFKVLLF